MAAANAGQAQENLNRCDEGRNNGQVINTEANYTPFEFFTPVATSTPCVGEASGPQSEPFLLPAGYKQQVVAEEPPGFNSAGLNQNSDNWDMNTQNEFGMDGRGSLRLPHPREPQQAVSDLADRPDHGC